MESAMDPIPDRQYGMVPVTRAELRAEVERLSRDVKILKEFAFKTQEALEKVLHAVSVEDSAKIWLPFLIREARIHLGIIKLCPACLYDITSAEHARCAAIKGDIKCEACGRKKNNSGMCPECPF